MQWSSGHCIKHIGGPFVETIGSVGNVSSDVFAGQGSQGQLVVGGGGVFGYGAGVGGQGAVTDTTVNRLGNIFNLL